MSLLVSLKEIITDGHKTQHLLFMWLKTGCYLQRTYTGIIQVKLHCLITLQRSPVYESLQGTINYLWAQIKIFIIIIIIIGRGPGISETTF